jgi:hypothetical protein
MGTVILSVVVFAMLIPLVAPCIGLYYAVTEGDSLLPRPLAIAQWGIILATVLALYAALENGLSLFSGILVAFGL